MYRLVDEDDGTVEVGAAGDGEYADGSGGEADEAVGGCNEDGDVDGDDEDDIEPLDEASITAAWGDATPSCCCCCCGC